MFEIEYNIESQTVHLAGKFEASKTTECQEVLDTIETSININMSRLEYICSAGVGVLVMTYSRLEELGEKVSLSNLNPHITKVFQISLLDTVFEIN